MRTSRSTVSVLLSVLLGLATFGGPPVVAQVADEQPLDPLADYVVQQMAMKLAAAQQVTFHLETTTDVISDGLRVSVRSGADVALRRPDRLAMHSVADSGRKGFRYDGRTVTLYHVDLELYSSVEVPSDIDGMVQHMFDQYGFTFPMADLILSDPYAALMEGAAGGEYVGIADIDGVRCHHLAFQAPGLQWQIWIEDSLWHFPRRYSYVLTDEPGCPGFTAEMSNWDYGAGLSDGLFEFAPPAIARSVPFHKVDK